MALTTYYLYSGKDTKPSNVTWWSDAFPDQAKERDDALKALNLADSWIRTLEDANNNSFQLYFTSIHNFNTFIATSSSLPSSLHWHNYNNEHGIVEIITHSGLVEVDPITLQQ